MRWSIFNHSLTYWQGPFLWMIGAFDGLCTPQGAKVAVSGRCNAVLLGLEPR